MANALSLVNPSHVSTAFEFDAYGNPTGSSLPGFTFNNSVNGASNPFYGMIYAPYSAFTSANQVFITGSIVAGTFTANNAITLTGSGGGGSGTSATAVYTAAYHQCPAAYSGDAGSGRY